MNKAHPSRRVVILLTILVCILTQTTRAATLIWTNTAGGLWSNATNWSPNTVPAAADTAIITNAGSYVITNNGTVTISTLTLGATNINGSPTLFTSSAFTVTNATVASNGVICLGAGTFTTAGAANIAGTFNQAIGTWQLNAAANINNYNLTNGELRGANCVITNFNWVGGGLNSDSFGNVTTVPGGGTLTISGATAKSLSYYVQPGRTLNNNGTAIWSGAGITGQGGATINNGGTMTLNGDFTFGWGAASPNPVFNNTGTLTKATGTGAFTLSQVYFNNYQTFNVTSGSVAINSSTMTNLGGINLSPSAYCDLNAGSICVLGGSLSSSSADHFRFLGATATLVTTNIATPSFLLSSGLLNQNTNVAVDTMNQANGTWQLNVPVAVNNYNLTNGELRGANVIITNLNWNGGAFNSDTLGTVTTIPAGGTMTISGATAKSLSYYNLPGRTLNNNGTATWTGAGITGQGSATINNAGSMTLNGDFGYAWGGANGAAVFNNTGTLTKASGSGAFTLSSIIMNNSSTVNIASGSLTFNSSQYHNNGTTTISAGTIAFNSSIGTNRNTLTLGATSFADFNAGSTYTLEGTVNSPAADHVRVQGATVDLATTNIFTPSLLIASGQLNQNAPVVVDTLNQAAGTWRVNLPTAINTYNLTNGEIRGANIVITNLNWVGGSLNSENVNSNTVTIPSGGTLNISGATAKALSDYSGTSGRRLINNGTGTWSGAGITGYWGAQFINYFLLNITTDLSYVWSGNGAAPVLANYGTLNLTSGTDFTISTVNFTNTGTFNITNGSLTMNGGSGGTAAFNSGTLNLDATSLLNADSGTFNLNGIVTAPTDNSLRFRGMTVTINTTNIATPSVLETAGTVLQTTNVVVPTYNIAAGTLAATTPLAFNTVNLTNAELRGANMTITNLNWLGGSLNSENANSNTVTIPGGGILNISGPTGKLLSDYSAAGGRRLINNGTATWSGAGITGYYGAQFINNNLLNITSDLGYVWSGNGNGPVLANNGTLNLTSGTDFTISTVNFTNTGTFNMTNGSLTMNGGSGGTAAYHSGVFNLDPTSVINADSGTFYLNGFTAAPTANSLRFRGMTVYINTTGLSTPALLETAGTVYQMTNAVVPIYNIGGGTLAPTTPLAFNIVNLTNSELRGANMTITNLNWLGGSLNSENANSNTVTIPAGGILNISGATTKLMSDYSAAGGRRLINNGTGTWSGAGITGYWGAQFINYFLLNITTDLSYVWSGNGAAPVLANYGTLNLTSGTDFTISTINFTNLGTFNITTGSFTMNGGSGGTTAYHSGVLSLDASSVINADSGTFYLNGLTTAPSGNSLRFRGMTVYINTTGLVTPALLETAGTVFQTTNVVVPVYNIGGGTLAPTTPLAFMTVNLTNSELRGANMTITNLNWLGGSLNSENVNSNSVTIPAGGTLNISGATTKALSDYSGTGGRRLINNGTATWSGAGITGYWGAQFINNNLLNITSDLGYVWSGNGNGPVLANNGTLNLTSGTDFTISTVAFTNTGTINISSGSLTMNGGSGGTTAFNSGALNLDAGSTLNADSGTFSLNGSLFAPSVNSIRFRGMTAYINTPNIGTPALLQTAGTVFQTTNVVVTTYNMSGGTLTPTIPMSFDTINMTNGELRGADMIINTFNWLGGGLNGDGAGSNLVTVASTLNIVGNTAKSMSYYVAPGRSLINNGTALWGGGSITFSGQSSFRNNGTWTVTNDLALGWTGTGAAAPIFYNNGTFTKSAGTGILTLGSTTFTNSGTVNINAGGVSIGGPFVQTTGSAYLGTNFSTSANASILVGSLTGRGSFAGAFYNNGTLNPGASPGFISAATFTNTSAAIYNVELGGVSGPGTNYDQLRFSGPVTLDGTLNVSLYNNFALVLSNRFTVLTTSARSGTFASVVPPPGATLNTIYSPTNVVLEVVGLTNAPLLILTNPVSQTIWTPDPVTFSAAVSGVTPITYQWQFNSNNIPNATNLSYTIPAVAVSNAGLYTLLITDGNGGTTNTSATLTVIPFANTIIWTNVLGGNWSAPANWLPNRIPNITNNVLIVTNGTYTVTVDTAAALSNFTVGALGATGTPTVELASGQSLTVSGSTRWETNTVFGLNGLLQMAGGSNDVRGRINWQFGTLAGAGRTVIASNATLTFIGSLNQKFIATNILENYGTFNYGNDSFGNAQGLRFSGGAQLTNYSSGIISIGTAAYDYSGSQTPRSYFVNYGTINANSSVVFSPTYLSIDFINYGTLQDNGYCYISRGTNYGTFQYANTLCEVSVFGDEATGEYFSFEDGTTLIGAFPNIAVGGYAQWNTTATHPGRLTVLSGSGGASFANPEFRVLKNYTQTGQTIVYKGRWTQANPVLTCDMNEFTDGLVNGFHSFFITNAGTLRVNNLSHGVRNFANLGAVIVRSNLTLSGSSYSYGGGSISITNGANATFSGGTVEAQTLLNRGTNIVSGAMAFTSNTSYRNFAGARTYFSGGSFSTGPASVVNEGLLEGFGGMTVNVTNRAAVLANDALNRNLALGTYVQEAGLTLLDPGQVSGDLNIIGGQVSGTNTVTGTLRNAANVAVGKPFGLLSITGNYTNTAAGTYILPISGAGQVTNFPQTRISGTAVFAGTLSVNFTNGFTPAPGNLFTAMTFTARSGAFDAIVNDTYGLEAFYTSTTLVLRAENLLPNVTLVLPPGNSNLVCKPFEITASATDPDGIVTNLTLIFASSTLATSTGTPVNGVVEKDFPGPNTVTATAIDDRGGVRTVTQTLDLVAPLETLVFGGVKTNGYKICMGGYLSTNYTIVTASNILVPPPNWAPLGSMDYTNGIFRFYDTRPLTNRPTLFYRAKR